MRPRRSPEMTPLRWILMGSVLTLLLGGAGTAPPLSTAQTAGVQFQDVTDQVGLNTEAMKWGDIAVGDYDSSGWDSVYLGHHGICNTAVGQPCTIGGVDGSQTWPKGGQLFHNNQNGTFSEATALLPDVTDTTQHRHIALWCDVEGTGYEDLILGTGFRSDLTDVTGVNDLWLHNTGAGFTDIAAQLGTTDLLSKVGAMTCGRLVSPTGPDVVLANWDPSPPLGEQPLHHLWVNFGTTFQEQGAQRGLTVTSNYYSHAVPYGLACADFRRQGAMDCLVSGINDSVWFLNRRDGTFDVTGGRYRTDIAELSPYNHDAYFADFTEHGLLVVAVADAQVNAVRILCNDGTT